MPHAHGGGGGGGSASSDYGSFGNQSPLNSILGGASVAGASSVASSPDIEHGRFYSGGGGYQQEYGAGGNGPSSVLLFGLSANPPTGRGGHAGIVAFLQAQGQWDEIWVRALLQVTIGVRWLRFCGGGSGHRSPSLSLTIPRIAHLHVYEPPLVSGPPRR